MRGPSSHLTWNDPESLDYVKSNKWVIPYQITKKKEKMKTQLFRFCLNLACGIIRDGDGDISIFSLIGQAVSGLWPI